MIRSSLNDTNKGFKTVRHSGPPCTLSLVRPVELPWPPWAAGSQRRRWCQAWYNAIDSTRNGDARGLSAQIQKDPKGMSVTGVTVDMYLEVPSVFYRFQVLSCSAL